MNDRTVRLSECWRECVQSPSDSAAWERLLRHHLPLFTGIAYRVASRWGAPAQGDIDEAVQEICLKLSSLARSRSTQAHQSNESLEAYLKALAANTASDFFRARGAKRRGSLVTVSLEAKAHELQDGLGIQSLDAHVLWREIENHVHELPQRERSVFLLYYRQGFTAREIASLPAVGLSEKGVESLLFRSVSVLRKRFSGADEGFSRKGTS